MVLGIMYLNNDKKGYEKNKNKKKKTKTLHLILWANAVWNRPQAMKNDAELRIYFINASRQHAFWISAVLKDKIYTVFALSFSFWIWKNWHRIFWWMLATLWLVLIEHSSTMILSIGKLIWTCFYLSWNNSSCLTIKALCFSITWKFEWWFNFPKLFFYFLIHQTTTHSDRLNWFDFV